MSSYDIAHLPESDSVLLVCGQGPGSDGAFFAVDLANNNAVEHIDPIGSFVTLIDGRIYRILNPTTAPPGTADMLVYDETGILDYHRLDYIADVHGIWWDGQHFAIPCSATNEIAWIDVHGRRARTWRAPGEDDSWHVNGLCFKEGRWYASAFGQGNTKREVDEQISRGARPGVIVDVETQTPVVSDLECPHDPLFLDGAWVVCNSRPRQLAKIDASTGEHIEDLQLAGWTRGVGVNSSHLYVGESAQRHWIGEPGRASIAVVDRRKFNLVDRISLPCVEVNTIRVVPKRMMEGLRRGFNTNPYRAAVLDRLAMFYTPGSSQPTIHWTRMEPLANSDCWIEVRALPSSMMNASAVMDVPIRIANLGTKTLLSAFPNPVYASYQWRALGSSNAVVLEGAREALMTPILPDHAITTSLSIEAPNEPGRYELVVTLVQEWVRWFHQVNSANAARFEILVKGPEFVNPSQASQFVENTLDAV